MAERATRPPPGNGEGREERPNAHRGAPSPNAISFRRGTPSGRVVPFRAPLGAGEKITEPNLLKQRQKWRPGQWGGGSGATAAVAAE